MSDTPAAGLRARVHRMLWPPQGEVSVVNAAIVAAIFCACAVTILETEPTLAQDPTGAAVFRVLNGTFLVLFLVEYVVRLWCVVEGPKFEGWRGRLRYALRPTALVDLIVLVPYALTLGGSDIVLLRTVRLLRLVMLARLGRLTEAGRLVVEAVAERSTELLLSAAVSFVLLIGASIALYFAEGTAQPEQFGSIPRAMWWAMATLTTVGYGDVYPVTVVGRVLAGITALAGVGVIAMPAGILAAAFSDAFQRRRERQRAEEVIDFE